MQDKVIYFISVIALWFAFMKGGEIYTNYKIISDLDEKIEFMIKNKVSHEDLCGQYHYAQGMAMTLKNQEKFDEYKQSAEKLFC